MRNVLVLFLSLALFACGGSSGPPEPPEPPDSEFSATTSITLELSGSQEVPAVDSAQQASAMVEIDSDEMLLRASLNASSVSGFSASHIHEGTIGTNGDVVFPFEQGAPDFGISGANYMIAETAVTQEQIDTLLAGGWYVNVHTDAYPGGELRAQILTDDFTLFTFPLSGDQGVPPVPTTASGSGYALVNTDTLELDLRAVTSGVDDAAAAHIHAGNVGENGGVLIGLEMDAMNTGAWMTPPGTVLDQGDLDTLLAGGLYVNVHTPAFGGGEIRGQILTDNFMLLTFPLSGDQGVPAVDTDAWGSGYALVDTDTLDIHLRAVTSGVDDAAAAHIHTGDVGVNGGVLIGLEMDVMNPGTWMTPPGAALDQEGFDTLLAGGLYVNVHTPAFGGGEIRGQILTDNFMLLTFPLSGDQGVPPVPTTASGSGYALVDTDTLDIHLRAVTSGVDDAAAAHIHAGNVGENGGVLIGLEMDAMNTGAWMTPPGTVLDQTGFDTLLAGGLYVNVHTPAFGGGEIRGQILTDNFMLFTFPLSGDQGVPPIPTTASGSGYVLANTDTFAIDLVAVTSGVDDAGAAHIHTGITGVNGGVLVPLEQDATDPGIWTVGTVMDQADFDVLLSGGLYVNVHTPAYGGGEIRGQIE